MGDIGVGVGDVGTLPGGGNDKGGTRCTSAVGRACAVPVGSDLRGTVGHTGTLCPPLCPQRPRVPIPAIPKDSCVPPLCPQDPHVLKDRVPKDPHIPPCPLPCARRPPCPHCVPKDLHVPYVPPHDPKDPVCPSVSPKAPLSPQVSPCHCVTSLSIPSCVTPSSVTRSGATPAVEVTTTGHGGDTAGTQLSLCAPRYIRSATVPIGSPLTAMLQLSPHPCEPMGSSCHRGPGDTSGDTVGTVPPRHPWGPPGAGTGLCHPRVPPSHHSRLTRCLPVPPRPIRGHQPWGGGGGTVPVEP